jgi:hypothetical protein
MRGMPKFKKNARVEICEGLLKANNNSKKPNSELCKSSESIHQARLVILRIQITEANK